MGITIDLLVGCSGGGVVCALRATGYDSAGIIRESRRTTEAIGQSFQTDYRTLLGIAKLPFGHYDISKGIIKQNGPLQLCREIFGDRLLEDLHPRILLQATDLRTGEGVVLSSGYTAEAVYATSALYPIFPPIHLDGKWLVDGAFISPLPVMEAIKRDVDVVIAMLFNEKLIEEPAHLFDGLHNAYRAFSLSLVKSQLSISVDWHHHEIVVINIVIEKPIPIHGAEYIPELLDIGRRAVDLKKDEIIKAIAHYSNSQG